MAKFDQDSEYTDDDPEARIRRRLEEQLGGGQAAPAPEPAPSTPSTQPAPFDQSAQYSGSGNGNTEQPSYVPPPDPVPPYAQSGSGNNEVQDTAPTYTQTVSAPAPTQTGATTPTPTPTTPAGFNQNGPWTADNVRAYFASRGVTPYGTSPDYWAGKWNEWGKNDPAYFMQRLAAADEFTGKPPGYVAPGSGGSAQPRAPQQSQFLGLSVPQGVWNSDFLQQIRQLLMERLKAASSPVDPNAPQINDPLVAARDEATRHTDKERTEMAERLYAQGGLNTDALTQGIQQSNERNATALGSLRAQLMTREFESKKAELRDLMQMALAAGDAQAAREIQMQIAELNAILQREGYGVQLAMNETNQNANALPY